MMADLERLIVQALRRLDLELAIVLFVAGLDPPRVPAAAEVLEKFSVSCKTRYPKCRNQEQARDAHAFNAHWRLLFDASPTHFDTACFARARSDLSRSLAGTMKVLDQTTAVLEAVFAALSLALALGFDFPFNTRGNMSFVH